MMSKKYTKAWHASYHQAMLDPIARRVANIRLPGHDIQITINRPPINKFMFKPPAFAFLQATLHQACEGVRAAHHSGADTYQDANHVELLPNQPPQTLLEQSLLKLDHPCAASMKKQGTALYQSAYPTLPGCLQYLCISVMVFP
jgi:hypothetical protein